MAGPGTAKPRASTPGPWAHSNLEPRAWTRTSRFLEPRWIEAGAAAGIGQLVLAGSLRAGRESLATSTWW